MEGDFLIFINVCYSYKLSTGKPLCVKLFLQQQRTGILFICIVYLLSLGSVLFWKYLITAVFFLYVSVVLTKKTEGGRKGKYEKKASRLNSFNGV